MEQSCRLCLDEPRPHLANHVTPLTDLFADEDFPRSEPVGKKRETPSAPRKVVPVELSSRKALKFDDVPPPPLPSPQSYAMGTPSTKKSGKATTSSWKSMTLSCTRNGEQVHSTIQFDDAKPFEMVTSDGLTLLDLWNKLK